MTTKVTCVTPLNINSHSSLLINNYGIVLLFLYHIGDIFYKGTLNWKILIVMKLFLTHICREIDEFRNFLFWPKNDFRK